MSKDLSDRNSIFIEGRELRIEKFSKRQSRKSECYLRRMRRQRLYWIYMLSWIIRNEKVQFIYSAHFADWRCVYGSCVDA
jgi:hypothetical protein